MSKKTKKIVSFLKNPAIYLILGMFFFPLGFDILFKVIMDMTGSFWITDAIFYIISIFFFILSYLLSKPRIFFNSHQSFGFGMLPELLSFLNQ